MFLFFKRYKEETLTIPTQVVMPCTFTPVLVCVCVCLCVCVYPHSLTHDNAHILATHTRKKKKMAL